MSNLHLAPNPTLKDIQIYVQQMIEERGFDDRNVSQACLLLTEEVGELIKSVRKSHAGMGTDVSRKYNENAAEEISDILIVLSTIANMLEVDMEQAFRDKEEHNKKRTWQ